MRTKILLLLLVTAVVPLSVVAHLMDRHSRAALERAMEARLREDVATTAQLLSQETSAAEEALRIIALVGRDANLSSELLSEILDVPQGDFVGFEYLEVLDSSGVRIAGTELTRDDVQRCGPGGRSPLLRSETFLGEDEARLAGGYRIGGSLPARGTTRLAVMDEAGRVVLSSSCDQTTPPLAGVYDSGVSGPTAFTLDARAGVSGESLGAYAPVSGTPWTAVITAPAPTPVSIWGTFGSPWWLVLGLGATVTLMMVSLFVGRVTSTIEDLTRAAERVGRGELRPWLPPPHDDEVGRLSLAFSEMTDRLRTKLELVDRNGRLAVMGQLSSYLAHEIRNPLSAVKMNLQRLQRWERQGRLPDQCRGPIDVSLKEVDRLSTTVKDVLQLGRAPDHAPEIVSVHELVMEASALLENEFDRKGIELRCELDAQGDRILARGGQVKGAIINLMLNALDAQPDGGALLIRSVLAPGDGGERGPRLQLRFRDDGPGVPSEIRDRILEPFFTTKENGSGIGLAVASQGVRENGGELFLEEPTRLRVGAEFVVSFPLAALSTDVDTRPKVPQLALWMERATVRSTTSGE